MFLSSNLILIHDSAMRLHDLGLTFKICHFRRKALALTFEVVILLNKLFLKHTCLHALSHSFRLYKLNA